MTIGKKNGRLPIKNVITDSKYISLFLLATRIHIVSKRGQGLKESVSEDIVGAIEENLANKTEDDTVEAEMINDHENAEQKKTEGNIISDDQKTDSDDMVYGGIALMDDKATDKVKRKNDIESRAKEIFEKIEELYPEHKIFAFDSVGGGLPDRLKNIYSQMGYDSVDDMLKAYGYEKISGDQVKDLRNTVIYKPGDEPPVIAEKISSMLNRLNEYYPDRKIKGSLQTQHKKLAQNVSGLYLWLGYESAGEMLKAYGYEYESISSGGRPSSTDPHAIVRELIERYRNKDIPESMNELVEQNPDLKGKIKTINNSAKETFGVSLAEYFKSVGLIKEKEKTVKEVRSKTYNFYKVCPLGSECSMYYMASTRSIREGNFVVIPIGILNTKALGIVEKTIICDASNAPCDINNTKNIIRALSAKDYKMNALRNTLRADAALTTNELIQKENIEEFHALDLNEIKMDNSVPWAYIRGLSLEIMNVLDYLVQKDDQSYSYEDIIFDGSGISELFIYTSDVGDILKRYPNVKLVMFSENKEEGLVDLCYSRSGYSFVTDSYRIGACDFDSASRWTVIHYYNFIEESIEYRFKYMDDWNELNYVFDDENGEKKQIRKEG